MSSTVTNAMDVAQLKFNEPISHDINDGEKTYYMQDLIYQNQPLYIQSDWFLSDGPKLNDYKKPELLVKIDGQMKSLFQAVENAARTQVKYPEAFKFDSTKNKDDFYRKLPEKGAMYCKLDRAVQAFDKNCKLLSANSLAYGKYRVIIHIKGIYIGQHGEQTYLSSLHMKIVQIQYVAEYLPCLFSLTPIVHQGVKEQISSNDKNDKNVPPSKSKKTSRRPRLQRQNAMVDNIPTAQAAPTSVGMDGLFDDLYL